MHQEACCHVGIVWNALGCQLQDSKNRLHGSSPTSFGIWGQCLGDSSQDAHQQTRQSSEYRLEDNPWCHESTPVAEMEKTAGVEPLEGRRQAKLLIHAEKIKRKPDHPLHQKRKDPRQKQKTTTTTTKVEKEKSEPPSKRTAERTCRHPYN